LATRAAVIVVDTAVWADCLSGIDSPQVGRLSQAVDRQDAGLVPVVLTEVLQGFRADRDFGRARDLLLGLPLLALDVDGHVEAARLYRRLRASGVTVRGTIDCIIAQTCITAGAELLSTDQDFAAIARHTPLRLCAV
jgi:predicted nucleic acid-binding protein